MFIGLSINAQTNKPFTPTKGEIVFREISKITDRKLFDDFLKKSKEKFKESLKKSLLRDAENKGKEKQIQEMIVAATDAIDFVYKEDSTEIYQYKFDEPIKQSFSEHVILKIVEDRSSKKIISGYDCYKVIYEYKENNEGNDENYIEFIRNTIYKREMWVTDKIRSLYHPVVFEKSILEKYYPLDILETQSDIKGYERKFILQTLTLK